MTWTQESQNRHQYSTDGRDSVEWQPTPVWRSDPAEKRWVSTTRNAEELLDGLLFFAVVALAITAEEYVSGFGFLSHLPGWLHGSLLIVTTVVSFLVSALVLYSAFVRALIKFAVFGVVAVLTGGIILPVIWHFL